MNQKYMNEMADALAEKHAALMVGSGFSKNAEKMAVTEKWFMNWKELSDVFYDALYGDVEVPGKEYNSSLRMAQEVEIMYGRPKLEKILKDAVPDLEYAPSDLYVKLMELPWKDVFTTNYDTLLERAADKVTSRRYHVVNCQEDLVNSNDEPRILKLHGSFPSHRPFIITEEDYRTYPVKFAALVNTVQQSMLENIFCMLGFSCEDPNFIKWIGWIHDNLGKSSSQRIYMVSVEHIAEAKRKMLFERNISVIDLQEFWPEKSIGERIDSFLDELKVGVDEKERKNSWFDIKGMRLNRDSEFSLKAHRMKELNESYPGWIFLPWNMKYKVQYVIDTFEYMDGLEKLALEEQINYIYEFVRFMDIAGRPLLMQYVNKFWNILESRLVNQQEKYSDAEQKRKVQVIYLQLLRAYRELAEWESYEECHKRIRIEKLNYDQRQFLYACDCWKMLFRFEAKELVEALDKWNLATGDVYWPLVKANMYAFIGETAKADTLLSETLILVRRQRCRKSRIEYLDSAEESIVALINFIRQGNWDSSEDEMEERRQESTLSWWNENEKYCACLNREEESDREGETRENFDLTSTYTICVGGKTNQKEIYALEYLRFLEQTGHPFRLQNVVNEAGLYPVLRCLAPYYPHWCLMQILVARDNKHLNIMFGRVKLAEFSQEEVDDTAKEYLKFFQSVKENVKSQNPFISRSIYEQAASVLPEIFSRFCYKCSDRVLDEIFNLIVEICLSSEKSNFNETRKLFQGLFEAYTVQKQNEKLEILLHLPMEDDVRTKYYDPVKLLAVPEKKQILRLEVYNKAIYQIRQQIENSDKEKSRAAIERLYALSRLIVLNKEDKDYLEQVLEKSKTQQDKWYLYKLDSQKYAKKKYEIYEDTMKTMKSDVSSTSITFNGYHYGYLLEVLKDMDIHKIDLQKTFERLREMTVSSFKRLQSHAAHVVWDRVHQGYSIAIGVLLLQKKSDMSFALEAQKEAIAYFEAVKREYHHPIAIDMMEAIFFGEYREEMNTFQIEVWLCEERELDLFLRFYRELHYHHIRISDDAFIENYAKLVFSVVVHRAISNELYHSRSVWCLYDTLIMCGIDVEDELQPVLASLSKCQEETIIKNTDSEQNAIYKLQCRQFACNIAKELQNRGLQADVLDTWQRIGKCKDEFIEVRNIWQNET